MSTIGSWALILALGLSAYSFLAGFLALFGKSAASARLSETARRAGIATFAAVLLGEVVLVLAAFNDDFSIAYIFHHSNRDLQAAYGFSVLWSGQEGSLLFWSLLLAGYQFVLRLRYKTDQRLFAYASVIIASVQVFFLLILKFCGEPVRHHAGRASRRRHWIESAAAVSRDGDSSADALSGVRRVYCPVRVCTGRAHHEVSRGERTIRCCGTRPSSVGWTNGSKRTIAAHPSDRSDFSARLLSLAARSASTGWPVPRPCRTRCCRSSDRWP